MSETCNARFLLCASLFVSALGAQDRPSTVAPAVGVDATEKTQDAKRADPMRALQEDAIRSYASKKSRPFSFGWHGLDGVFSTHQNHSNRPVPAVVLGAKASMDTITGKASPYRKSSALAKIYGARIPRTVHARHVYGDQTQLYGLLKNAVERGAKRVVVLLMDGADWHVYAGAAAATGRKVDTKGYEHDLAFFRYRPPGHGSDRPLRSVGAVVTSPLGSMPPGFNLELGGQYPWSPQSGTYLAGDFRLGGYDAKTIHAVTDSASSATSISTGRKTLNARIGMDRARRALVPLGRELQKAGWTVATVTDVPFNHASPASFYASSEHREKYEEIGRQMLGIEKYDGLDVVLGYGFEYQYSATTRYLALSDLEQLGDETRYRIVTSAADNAGDALMRAASKVASARAEGSKLRARLFGFFGSAKLNHAPYRTTDGRYDPAPHLLAGLPAAGESYDAATLARMPTLQQMTRAAIEVIDATPERSALLFVESGLVDWASHANNFDNVVGEVRSAEAAFEILAEWITRTAGWEDTVMLVTSDHGHLLQVDFAALQKLVAG